jgi:hypothetical protein
MDMPLKERCEGGFIAPGVSFYQRDVIGLGHLPNDVRQKKVVTGFLRFLFGAFAITKGKLDFGPWEQIFYAAFDGRRRKRVLVKIIGK